MPQWRQWLVSPAGVEAWTRLTPSLRRRLGEPGLKDLTQVRRLGVLRPDGMGDIVLTTGLLRQLRRQLPQARITFICQTEWANWMRTCPWVDEVLDVAVTTSGRFREPKRLWSMFEFVRRVWPLRLEAVLQPGTLFEYVPSRTLAWFSGAPTRVCWEDSHAGVDTGGRLHTRVLDFPNQWHETDKCFRMLEAVGLEAEGPRLETWWTPEDAGRADAWAQSARKGRSELIAIGLGASEARKRWPPERYLELVRRVRATRDAAFLVLGGPDVAASCRGLAEDAPDDVTWLGDRLPLGAVWATLAKCDLFVGNDTGFMHMAAAARIPVVAVIGLSPNAPPGLPRAPSSTGPLTSHTVARVVLPPSDTPAEAPLNAALVPVEPVVEAALELLRSATRAGTRGAS